MAERAKVDLPANTWGDSCQYVRWNGLLQTSSDTGEAFECPGAADRSVQLLGTLGTGGAVTIEGSNAAAPGVNDWGVLTDPQGNNLVLTSIGKVEAVSEVTRWIRPRVTAGDGTTNLDVALVARRP